MFCKEHETCLLDDDIQAIYPKIRQTDGLIIATPVMTMGIPGKLKSLIDRQSTCVKNLLYQTKRNPGEEDFLSVFPV
jgi:multimeric flavodoxin WrbA